MRVMAWIPIRINICENGTSLRLNVSYVPQFRTHLYRYSLNKCIMSCSCYANVNIMINYMTSIDFSLQVLIYAIYGIGRRFWGGGVSCIGVASRWWLENVIACFFVWCVSLVFFLFIFQQSSVASVCDIVFPPQPSRHTYCAEISCLPSNKHSDIDKINKNNIPYSVDFVSSHCTKFSMGQQHVNNDTAEGDVKHSSWYKWIQITYVSFVSEMGAQHSNTNFNYTSPIGNHSWLNGLTTCAGNFYLLT